ncbi:hypothetical protein [Granulicoccus phenolivorans]|uniref:hypothetical protein n=1 Tax=Granulicoccus phenolivorans TaxID=266854 RepID=UPI0003FF206B|nr:hypothetical protein [Granulicoccus phenolivorans]
MSETSPPAPELPDPATTAADPPGFEVYVSSADARRRRQFWASRTGLLVLVGPPLLITVMGIILIAAVPGSGGLAAGILVIACGLAGAYLGYANWRRARARAQTAPLAFALTERGVWFAGKPVPWERAQFFLTDDAEPQLICGPVAMAFRVSDLSQPVDRIAAEIAERSGGRQHLVA